ncbi:MAG: peptidoglycan DD-metalloendopeptidase family protein [Gammaproteobacteria bacterium]|nr:peptidoglycan DD-metalloendopeptidase family protein [Gammaproteobacteria bacterium]
MKRSFALMALVLVGGCAGILNLPETHRPQSHTVQGGDTLYSIAWHYGLNYHVVAEWNGIEPPYRIYPGQRIFLYPGHASSAESGGVAKRGNESDDASKTETFPAPRGGKTGARPGSSASAPQWQWPAEGAVRRTFGQSGIAGKGIVIAGKLGEPVRAAAGGTVVYSGDALVGYGRLIIVKHNDRWLSAYAHNQRLLAHEGETVSAGDRIATMGRAPNGDPALYFEIRKDGAPVNPLHYLSDRR